MNVLTNSSFHEKVPKNEGAEVQRIGCRICGLHKPSRKMLYNALRRRANLKLLQKNARKVTLTATTSYHDAESEINPNAVQLDEVQVSRCSFFLLSKSLGVYSGRSILGILIQHPIVDYRRKHQSYSPLPKTSGKPMLLYYFQHIVTDGPSKTFTLSDFGYSASALNAPDFAATEPFRLLTPSCISALKSEIAHHRDTSTYSCPPFAPCVVRGLAHKSAFINDLWSSSAMREVVSKAVGEELEPHPMLFERGHVNVQNNQPKLEADDEDQVRGGLRSGRYGGTKFRKSLAESYLPTLSDPLFPSPPTLGARLWLAYRQSALRLHRNVI